MKGLLLKDFYIIRDNLLVLFVIFIAMGVSLSFLLSPYVLIPVATITLSMQAVNTIQNDKSTQWNRFSATLPMSREQVVESKYILYLFLSLAGIVFGIFICLIASLFQHSLDFSELLLYSDVAIILSLLPGSISIPSAFIFDEEKSIMGTILSYIVTAGVFAGIIFVLSKFIDLEKSIFVICGITVACSVVAFILSWLISPKKLSRRDI